MPSFCVPRNPRLPRRAGADYLSPPCIRRLALAALTAYDRRDATTR
jgi:hypothetical protein